MTLLDVVRCDGPGCNVQEALGGAKNGERHEWFVVRRLPSERLKAPDAEPFHLCSAACMVALAAIEWTDEEVKG